MDSDNITTIIVALITGFFSWMAARQAMMAQEARREAEMDKKATSTEATGLATQMQRIEAMVEAIAEQRDDDTSQGTDT